MTLRRPVPPGRTEESLRRHYETERRLADRLRASTREERTRLYATMYDELFQAVPDHPRLTATEDPASLDRKNRDKLSLVEPWLRPESVFVEFAAGDCSFAALVAARVAKAIAIDISDQRPAGAPRPPNLELVIYDGYALDLPPGGADLVFSDQFLEHLHPDDVDHHLRLALGLLRPGGRYALRTPHRFSGPHDISRYFDDEPRGFHLHEWTYGEMAGALRAAGYGAIEGGRRVRGRYRPVPLGPLVFAERLFGPLPHGLRRRLSKPFLARNLVLFAAR
jgi:SAM-dependent methyltransferase